MKTLFKVRVSIKPVASSSVILLVLGIAAAALGSTSKPVASGFGMTPEQFWHTPFGVGDWIPLIGDVDGDGRADMIALQTDGDSSIAVSRTSALGKPRLEERVLNGFGNGALAAACGKFIRDAPPAFLGVFADGSVRVASGFDRVGKRYLHDDLALKLPNQLIPKAPVRTAVADFEGNGRQDVLMLDGAGNLLLLRSEKGTGTSPQFSVCPIGSRLPNLRQFSAGIITGLKPDEDPRAQCVWLDSEGTVSRAFINSNSAGAANLGAVTPFAKASPDDHMVVGRFRGASLADVLIGQRLLPGGDPKAAMVMSDLPTLEVAKGDGPWCVGDVAGNGKDDLVRYRRTGQGYTGNDTFIHFSFDSSDPDKGFYCSAHDGLPDFWKRGRVKPGGLDLAAIGCHVGRRDIVLQLERFDNVDEGHLRGQMDAAVKYFDSLPIKNPDGSVGIDLHVIYQKPWPFRKHDEVISNFDDKFPPVEVRGIVHSAFAENNGPLVSKINGDNSHFNGNWREFLHEFGHQLDLTHTGHWGSPTPGFTDFAGCALYPSLMSYAYSYAQGPRVGNTIGYSEGLFTRMKIDDQHLNKHMPFPIDQLYFLKTDPYFFHLKADADGKGTWVDWNWDGLFDETDVAADIHFAQGSDMGTRYEIGRTPNAPVLVAHGEGSQAKLLLLYGRTSAGKSQVVMRTWLGTNRDTEGGNWSGEIPIDDDDVTGDVSAVYLGNGATWLAYPTSHGIVLRRVTLDSHGLPVAGAAREIPNSLDAENTLATFRGQLALLLWRGQKKPVGLILLTANQSDITAISTEAQLSFSSKFPVAAAEGEASLWVDRMEDTGEHLNLSEVVRLAPGTDGRWGVVTRHWLFGGYAQHRATLLWRKEAGLLPEGRLYHLDGGGDNDQFITMNVPYPEIGGGWLVRRYDGPDYKSDSAVGACFFQGNIAYAVRLRTPDKSFNKPLQVAFYANGAVPYFMGDFDDIGHIRDFGLEHSIPLLSN
jgi:hypothetical protein